MKVEVKEFKRKNTLKIGATVALIILLFNVVRQLVAVYQAREELTSPLIPESTIWEINKQFIFHALVYSIASIVAFLVYVFGKYLLVIILVVLTILANRYIYV